MTPPSTPSFILTSSKGRLCPLPLLLTEHVVKMPFPPLLLLLPTHPLLPHLFPHSCFLVPGCAALHPSPVDALPCSACLHLALCAPMRWECPPPLPFPPLLPRTLLHTHRSCGRREPGRCTDVRMFRVWACALRSPLPARARRDVIACLAHHRSESAPSVGTPPPSQLCDKHQSRAAACAESRGCCYYYEGLGGRRRTGGCGDGSAASVLSKWMRGIARWSKQRYSRRW